MNLFRHIIILSAALVLASCAIDEPWTESNHIDGEEVLMTFTPSFVDFDAATKAIGDASLVDQLLVHVYEGDKKTFDDSFKIQGKVLQEAVSIPFAYGKDYTVYFFAYNSSDDTYEISANGLIDGITINYPSGEQTYDALEALDAFYSVKNINLSADDLSSDVTLTRPFAQVNLAANKDDLSAASATKVEISINAARTYNLETGATSNAATQTFTFVSDNNFQSNEIATNGNVYLGTTYLFVPSGATELEATITLYDADDNILNDSATPVQIPLASNSRTNLVFSDVEPAGPAAIIIETPEDLESFLLNGADEGTKAVIAENIDMSGKSLSPKSFKSLELDGNGKTITGLTFSLFNEASDVNVYDLTIADAAITGATHVGVLVNTLKGTGTFTDINIINSSVSTTNGAAGGVVGYISKLTEKDRDLEVNVTFDVCVLDGVTVSGSSSEGKFVGLLSGYDNKEVLEFTNCSATSVTLADYTSVYKSANQSAWLASIDSKYDGWLGHETYRRGVVMFDGKRLVPRWDGTIDATVKSNLLLNNGTSGKYEVYSPYDLAAVRNTTASPSALYLMENVDMFGQGKDGKYNVPTNWTQSAIASDDDKYFQSFSTITYLDGGKNGIYNLAINTQKVSTSLYYGGFIQSTSGTTTHKDINFNDCCVVVPLVVYKNEDKGSAGMLVSNIAGDSYTMQNVHTYGCKIFALQKIGGLAARVAATSATIKSCSVNNCYIENYECKEHEETFSGGNSLASISTTFYSYGEVGGMFGFVENNTTIDDCHVKGTTIYAYGQDDKSASKSGLAFILSSYYLVPGRHVATFIGDVRTSDDDKDVITITNCSVDDITKCTNRWDKHNNKCPTIGRAYFLYLKDTEGTVNYNTTKLTLMNCKTKQNRDQ